jgi:hypothetical protein
LREAAERVSEVAQLLARLDSLDEVALVLAARGRPLEPASVKSALIAVLASMDRDLHSHKPLSEDPHVIAQNAARALKRAIGRTTGDRAPAPVGTSTEALAIAGRILMGIQIPTADLEIFLEESQLVEIAAKLGATKEDLLRHVEKVLPYCSHTAIRAFAEAQEPAAIVQAFQTINALIDRLVPASFFRGDTSRDVAVVTAALGTLAAASLAQPMRNAS